MELHHIVDFCSSPQDHELWVVLEQVPSAAWTARLDRALDDGVQRVRPAMADGERLGLRTDAGDGPGHVDEYEALTLLAAYIDHANHAVPRAPSAPPAPAAPPAALKRRLRLRPTTE